MKKLSLIPLISLAFAGFASAEDAPKPFQTFDADKNGKVAYLEYAKAKKGEFDALDRDRSRGLTLAEAEKAPMVAEDDFFSLPSFDEMDSDSNQTLTLAEYGTGVQTVFNFLDAIKDGEMDKIVTLPEYLMAIQKAKVAAASGTAASAATKGSRKGSQAKAKAKATPDAK
ncbi:MAG: hypothetical protein ACI8UO_003428 [Verrucomicrobiales bacterium]|jgi:hypothetical protein